MMYVDFDRTIFTVPYLNHPVSWYGLLFAIGFFGGYFLIRRLFAAHLADPSQSPEKIKLNAITLADRLSALVIIGTIIGARLGEVFFYGWPYYRHHLLEIFMVWRGGLASHGAAIGILVALLIFVLWNRKRYPTITFLATFDGLVISAAFAGGCIRIGNFINQEILGTPTSLPWGVAFGRPFDGMAGVALHPVQLYEALFYFLVFGFLLFLWRRHGRRLGSGFLSGWFLSLVFTFRFFVEFIKLPQSQLISESSWLNMGQILSIPFILFGVALLLNYYCRKKRVV